MFRKIFIALLFLSCTSSFVFSQTELRRPRIVEVATPTPFPAATPVESNSTRITLPSAPPPMPVVDEDEIISVNTNLIKLPVSVLDRSGRFITGLDQNDFEIFENGDKQNVEYFATVEQPFTVILLLDVSPSTKYKITDIQNAAISFVEELRRDDRVIIATFSNKIDVVSRNNTSFHRIRQAIRGTQFGKGTSLYDAVDFAFNDLIKSIEGRKAIVIFSDGVDTSSKSGGYIKTMKRAEFIDALVYPVRYDTFEEYKTKDTAGNVIYSVGSSPQEYARGKKYLEDITAKSGGRMFEASTVENLEAAFHNIAEELRTQYSLGYYPVNEGTQGERKQILVRIKRADLIVRSKDSYTVDLSSNN